MDTVSAWNIHKKDHKSIYITHPGIIHICPGAPRCQHMCEHWSRTWSEDNIKSPKRCMYLSRCQYDWSKCWSNQSGCTQVPCSYTSTNTSPKWQKTKTAKPKVSVWAVIIPIWVSDWAIWTPPSSKLLIRMDFVMVLSHVLLVDVMPKTTWTCVVSAPLQTAAHILALSYMIWGDLLGISSPTKTCHNDHRWPFQWNVSFHAHRA